MRVVRILVYEGSSEFLDRSLNGRGVVGRKGVAGAGSITEYFITGPVPFSTDATELLTALCIPVAGYPDGEGLDSILKD